MSPLPSFPIDPILLAADPVLPRDVLVAGGAPEVLAPAPPDGAPPPPALVPEDAFPTAAALDALHAELSAPPPGPDLALREEVAALLGLDPAIAADAALFEATLAALPPPAPEPDPEPLSAAPWPAFDWAAMSRDWGDLSKGWILG